MPIELESLPTPVMNSYLDLRRELVELLGDQLVALWGFGAAIMSDAPKRLGDIDSYGILRSSPEREVVQSIDAIQEQIAKEHGIEWDSWYILEESASGSCIPMHAFRENLPETSWALHRAHWLSGHYVPLAGKRPEHLVPEPNWREIEEALGSELGFVNEVAEARIDAGHCAFAVWNGCRILYSFETRDVVISKRGAAKWALQHLTQEWHELIRAAARVYDNEVQPADAELLERLTKPFADFVTNHVR